MICPECGEENQDSAKFCKNCGTSLTIATINNDSNSNIQSKSIKSDIFQDSNSHSPSSFESKSGGDNKNLIIICLTIIICAVLIAGGLIFMSNTGSSDNGASDSISLADDASQSDDTVNQSVETTSSNADNRASDSNMKILSGSFKTGSSSDSKTDCTVFVGNQYAGESVKISVLYSFGGSNLNQGNIVPKTVSNDGYISVPTANALEYYPDHAFITIYDSNGNVLDTQDVNMLTQPGTQTF